MAKQRLFRFETYTRRVLIIAIDALTIKGLSYMLRTEFDEKKRKIKYKFFIKGDENDEKDFYFIVDCIKH